MPSNRRMLAPPLPWFGGTRRPIHDVQRGVRVDMKLWDYVSTLNPGVRTARRVQFLPTAGARGSTVNHSRACEPTDRLSAGAKQGLAGKRSGDVAEVAS